MPEALVEPVSAAVVSLWRYPVKSMQGEEINSTVVTERGLLGDRAFALMDAEDGKTVTAKNPKKWPTMFKFRAAFVDSPTVPSVMPSVKITTPEGVTISSTESDLNEKLSQNLGRAVVFAGQPPEKPHLDEYWPEDVPGLPFSDHVTDENTLEGTFFDLAIIHILTTSTIDALRAAYPHGRFEARRFRPNIIIDTGTQGFAENAWIVRSDRAVSPLCHDNLAAERSAAGHRHSQDGSAAERGSCGRLCERRAQWDHQTGR